MKIKNKAIQLIFLFCCGLFSLHAQADSTIKWQELHIPFAKSKGLATVIVWPDDGKKHPMAIISHGAPRDAADRATMTPFTYLNIAKELARRGYSVAIVLRRGYGDTDTPLAEGIGACKNPNYLRSAQESASDIRFAINYLKTLPQFDASTILAIGFSAGGLATTALTANPPEGLKAAISFAGGRGSYAENSVCQESALINTYAELGKTSRVPMLWIYANNDHYFNPALAQQFYEAFTHSGGQAQMIKAPDFGEDGHYLFSSGMTEWIGWVDNFLHKQHLIFNTPLLALPPEMEIPAGLSANAKKAFMKYRAGNIHRAFALAEDGAWGWTTNQFTRDKAVEKALNYCKKYTKKTCKVIAIDEEMT